MEKTLVAVFENNAEAERARQKLVEAGIVETDISMRSDIESGGDDSSSRKAVDAENSGGFFSWLFGLDDNEKTEGNQYRDAMRRGNVVLTVRSRDENLTDRIADILDDCGAIDVDARGQSSSEPALEASRNRSDKSQATTDNDTQRLSVVEEELQVGKRPVQRGGVRVYKRVSETPVEQTVFLREELVGVHRRQVDRPATEADLAAMQEGTIEVRESGEEAVVAKVARVTEEIEIDKKTLDREKTVRDTVRKTDVEIEDLSEETAPAARSGEETKKRVVKKSPK
jgi:uncharacterized protein (TIGR02271 family)